MKTTKKIFIMLALFAMTVVEQLSVRNKSKAKPYLICFL